MVAERIGQRYAKAIMDLAIQKGIDKQVLEDMELFRTVCRENREFVLMLRSPLIQADKKKQILQSLFRDKMNPLLMEAFALITHKNRSAVLTTIGEEYIQLYRRLHNITEVQVITASPVSEATRSALLTKIEELLALQASNGKQSKSTISLVEKTDAALIGGFILRAGDLQFDQSFSESLRRLSQQFNSNPYIKN
jgi:F-type H+-transporting ATPase subunit delta